MRVRAMAQTVCVLPDAADTTRLSAIAADRSRHQGAPCRGRPRGGGDKRCGLPKQAPTDACARPRGVLFSRWLHGQTIDGVERCLRAERDCRRHSGVGERVIAGCNRRPEVECRRDWLDAQCEVSAALVARVPATCAKPVSQKWPPVLRRKPATSQGSKRRMRWCTNATLLRPGSRGPVPADVIR